MVLPDDFDPGQRPSLVAGAHGTWFWIDPANGLVLIGMTQLLGATSPSGHPPDLRRISAKRVYAALAAGRRGRGCE